MLNLYEAVRSNPGYKKLEIGEFLFAEYTCGITAKKLPNWTATDYLVHVVSGRKTWHTPEGSCQARPGETWFFKKGASIVEQHFEQDLCVLMVFIPDEMVRATVRELAGSLTAGAGTAAPVKSAARVEHDLALAAFFQSMRTYVSGSEQPSEALLRLKLKELVLSVLTSDSNFGLAAYFRKLGESDAPSVAEMMEANFRYNLSLEEYARLCHRSLSSFKREFGAVFQEPPGKWLLRKRVEWAANLLRNSKMNVTEVAYESGFQDVSHFSRAFKARLGVSPLAYRQNSLVPA